MTDIEIQLARNLGWNLYDVDRTDIGSLIPFVLRFARKHGAKGLPGRKKTRRVFCDQVSL